MAFRELHMIDVREVLRRWQAGQSARKIHEDKIADRKTASRYTAAATMLGISAQDALTDDVVRGVMMHVQARPKPAPSEQWKTLEKQRVRIEEWLGAKRPFTLVRIHELLVRDGVDVSYTTLRRFARSELGWHEPRSNVLVEDPPLGDEAQIDFGLMGHVDDDGKRRRLWALIVTLTCSRYTFVYPTFTQTVEDVCAVLDAAWSFFGGVPRRIVDHKSL